jgi:hypothetical protein
MLGAKEKGKKNPHPPPLTTLKRIEKIVGIRIVQFWAWEGGKGGGKTIFFSKFKLIFLRLYHILGVKFSKCGRGEGGGKGWK